MPPSGRASVVPMQVTARGRGWGHERQAQRVHGVAATNWATAAKPAAAGMGHGDGGTLRVLSHRQHAHTASHASAPTVRYHRHQVRARK